MAFVSSRRGLGSCGKERRDRVVIDNQIFFISKRKIMGHF